MKEMEDNPRRPNGGGLGAGPIDAGPADPADPGARDAGPADAGARDAGPADGAAIDVAPPDPGAHDLGLADAGRPAENVVFQDGEAEVIEADPNEVEQIRYLQDLGHRPLPVLDPLPPEGPQMHNNDPPPAQRDQDAREPGEGPDMPPEIIEPEPRPRPVEVIDPRPAPEPPPDPIEMIPPVEPPIP
jgi:hypothetical protein